MPAESSSFSVVAVECYAGYRGEETPRRFRVGMHQIEVSQVVDAWMTPDHRYFKVRDPDGRDYVLRHNVGADRWELARLHGS